MADLTITAANVLKGSGASIQKGFAGASITAGMVIYLDPATTTLKIANCVTSLVTATVVGIALHAATAGQPLQYIGGGLYTVGATVVVGTVYVLSETGLICPYADLASNDWVAILGYAPNTTQILVGITNTGVQKP